MIVYNVDSLEHDASVKGCPRGCSSLTSGILWSLTFKSLVKSPSACTRTLLSTVHRYVSITKIEFESQPVWLGIRRKWWAQDPLNRLLAIQGFKQYDATPSDNAFLVRIYKAEAWLPRHSWMSQNYADAGCRKCRTHLTVAMSQDGARTWSEVAVIEKGHVDFKKSHYPTMLQVSNFHWMVQVHSHSDPYQAYAMCSCLAWENVCWHKMISTHQVKGLKGILEGSMRIHDDVSICTIWHNPCPVGGNHIKYGWYCFRVSKYERWYDCQECLFHLSTMHR